MKWKADIRWREEGRIAPHLWGGFCDADSEPEARSILWSLFREGHPTEEPYFLKVDLWEKVGDRWQSASNLA